MSEPALILPTSLEYGYVDARIILAVADTEDEDRLPNAIPASGTITLTPLNDKTVESEEEPVIVGRHSISGTLDTTGRLRDSQGQRGLWVITGLYSVSYNLTGVSVGGHSVLVTSDHTESNPLHLATAAQPTDGPISPTEYQQLSARIDGIPTGVDRAPVTVLTNPTTIPTETSGRLDLVFTEPTTVAFDAPGRTDLVLAIEGYQNITWEGVVVHGTPDVTGVVWASAMWRDRDSTWHLLCEQDASQGGGGGSGMSLVKFESPLLMYGPVPGGPVDERGMPTTFETTLLSGGWTHYEMVTTFVDPTTGNPRDAFVDFLPPGPGFASRSSLSMINFSYLNSDTEPTDGIMISGEFNFRAGKWALGGSLYVVDGFTFPNNAPLRVASREMVPHFFGAGYLQIPIPTSWGGVFTLQIVENVGVTLHYSGTHPVTHQPNPPIPQAPLTDPEDPNSLRMHVIQIEETGTFSHREVRLPEGTS